MYSYIKGLITEVTAKYITIENNGIGYLVKVGNPYSFKKDENTTIYIHHHVREDAIELYGFHNNLEKDIFEKLISVKGLGPKGALAIIAQSTPEEIASNVKDQNDKYFNQFPGIGPKLSQQIILDLKGKLSFVDNSYTIDPRLEKISEGLKALGYTQADIKSVMKKVVLNNDTTESDAFKQCLKLLKK